jgi:hypothetical protein
MIPSKMIDLQSNKSGFYQTHFLGNNFDTGLINNSTVGSWAAIASVAGFPGIFQASNSAAGLTSFRQAYGAVVASNTIFETFCTFRFPVAADSTNNFRIFFGFSNDYGTGVSNMLQNAFFFIPGLTGGTSVTRSNGFATQSTGNLPTLVANTWYTARARLNAASSAQFDLWTPTNGANIYTMQHTLAIPPLGSILGPVFVMDRIAGTTARTVHVDHYGFRWEYT